MATTKIFIPYGAVGLNCREDAFEAGLAMGPDIISSDAGSTDSGPYYRARAAGSTPRRTCAATSGAWCSARTSSASR